MRQGGMKPKGHNSGTYWVRANAQSGGGKTKKQIGIDTDGDGEADFYIDEDELEKSTLQMWVDVTTRLALIFGGVGIVVSMFFA
jgi:hypothetical protein